MEATSCPELASKWILEPASLSQKVTNAPMSFVKARAAVTLCSATPFGVQDTWEARTSKICARGSVRPGVLGPQRSCGVRELNFYHQVQLRRAAATAELAVGIVGGAAYGLACGMD